MNTASVTELTPNNNYYLKITYNYEWIQRGAPSVGYAEYETREEMELCRDNLRRTGNGAIEITRSQYDAAIAEIYEEAP